MLDTLSVALPTASKHWLEPKILLFVSLFLIHKYLRYPDVDGIKICNSCFLSEPYQTTTATTVLPPFDWDDTGEPVPEETFTNSHLSWSSTILYKLSLSTTIYSILPVQFTCLTVFLNNLSPSPLCYLLFWNPPLHTPYISSPNHSLLFTTHTHTITTCFVVIPILCKSPITMIDNSKTINLFAYI